MKYTYNIQYQIYNERNIKGSWGFGFWKYFPRGPVKACWEEWIICWIKLAGHTPSVTLISLWAVMELELEFHWGPHTKTHHTRWKRATHTQHKQTPNCGAWRANQTNKWFRSLITTIQRSISSVTLELHVGNQKMDSTNCENMNIKTESADCLFQNFRHKYRGN